MSSTNAFIPAGVLDLTTQGDEPQFESVSDPHVEVQGRSEAGIEGPTEEEIRQAIEEQERNEGAAPEKIGAFAPNLRVTGRSSSVDKACRRFQPTKILGICWNTSRLKSRCAGSRLRGQCWRSSLTACNNIWARAGSPRDSMNGLGNLKFEQAIRCGW